MKNLDDILDKVIIAGFGLYALGAVVSLGIMNTGLTLAFLAWIIKKIRDFKIKSTPFDKYVLFFLVAIVFSFIGSWDLLNSINYFKRYLYPILLFYMIIDLNPDVKLIKFFFAIIFITYLGSVSYGLWQYHIGINRIHSNLFVMEYATLLLIVLMYSITYGLWSKDGYKKRVVSIVLSIIFIISLLFTLTRGAWIALVIGICVITAIRDRRILISIIILSSIFLIVAPYFIPDIYVNRFMSIFDIKHNKGNITRLNLWRSALLIYKDHWINGIGLNNFSKVVKLEPYFHESMISTSHAHNNFLQIAAETGSIGLTSFLLLFYVIIKKLYIFYQSTTNHNLKLFFLGTLGVIVVYLTHGLTEYILNDRFTGRLVWFILGISIVLARRKKLLSE